MKCLLIVCLLFSATIAVAQDNSPTPEDVAKSNDPPSILLLVNESQPNQVIVYDTKGVWLFSIRQIKITLDLAGAGIKAECMAWKGVYKPTAPKKFTAIVKEIKSIPSSAFKERVEELNTK